MSLTRFKLRLFYSEDSKLFYIKTLSKRLYGQTAVKEKMIKQLDDLKAGCVNGMGGFGVMASLLERLQSGGDWIYITVDRGIFSNYFRRDGNAKV
jgi:hypothetical protein